MKPLANHLSIEDKLKLPIGRVGYVIKALIYTAQDKYPDNKVLKGDLSVTSAEIE